MNRTSLLNLLALAAALALTAATAWPRPGAGNRGLRVRGMRTGSHAVAQSLPEGGLAVADASGHLVPLRHYRRIVSTNLVTDRLLVELCEPTRIRAVSSAAAARKRDGHRYRGLTTVDGFGPPEAIVALAPDLVLANSFGAPGSAERLRGAGIEVFDLGELRGESSLHTVATSLGLLLGDPARAARLLGSFSQRMRALAARLGTRPRLRALYLSRLGPDLQGGTVGTSYHDIMTAAGLADVAAERYRDWPAYSAEQVLELGPEVIVTREGFATGVCGYPGMDRLGPCRGEGRILELPGELLDEPGLAMLEAAEELFALAYEEP
ncbi:MAG: ABC transporter substrate-binding protein [Deltaproteobacteria bacterium]|nr:ABC transporter substrate-binding protein [Deltaproteobacteria bacterium]